MFGTIFSAVIFGGCALIMLGIGIAQYRCKEPVGFYTGQEPPRREQLTDVTAWNHRHGVMFMLYACCIAAGWLVSFLLGDDLLALIPMNAGLLLPIPCLMLYHRRLVKRYLLP